MPLTVRLLLATAALLTSGSVGAQTYSIPPPPPEPEPEIRWLTAYTDDSQTVEVDIQTIDDQGTTVVFWTRTNFASTETSPHGTLYDAAKQQTELDCATRRYRVTFEVLYLDGEIAESYSPNRWSPLIPDSVGEVYMDSICQGFGT